MYSNTYRKNGPKSTLRIECALAFWPDVPSGIRQCALCICRGSTAVRALSSRVPEAVGMGQGTVPSGPVAAAAPAARAGHCAFRTQRRADVRLAVPCLCLQDPVALSASITC